MLPSAAGVAPPGAVRSVSADGAAPTSPLSEAPCGWRSSPPRTYDSVVWIVLENHGFRDLIGPTGSAARATSPYLNFLADACGSATNYWGITHPSLPNYLAMVSGSTGGVARSCRPSACPQDRPTIFDQLRATGRDWRVYNESMPEACHRRDAYPYVVRHNAPLYFPSVRGCARRDLPMGSTTSGPFLNRVQNGRLPALTIVVPDQCSNTHDCPIETGDTWLSELVPQILDGPDYAAGRTAVVVTWDEGSGGYPGKNCRKERGDSCHLATVVISPSTVPGTSSGLRFDHYSLLETAQRMLGVRPLLRHAADERTRSMRPAFNL